MENGGKRIGGGNKQWRGWRIRAWVCSIGFESVGVLHDRVETLRKKERRDLGGERTRRRGSEEEGEEEEEKKGQESWGARRGRVHQKPDFN